MSKWKENILSNGEIQHEVVSFLIESEGKYLLIDRAYEPKGITFITGHVESGETWEECLERELKEETGLTLDSSEIVSEFVFDIPCNKSAVHHKIITYNCKVSGNLKDPEDEVLDFKWLTREEIKEQEINNHWKPLFRELGFI